MVFSDRDNGFKDNKSGISHKIVTIFLVLIILYLISWGPILYISSWSTATPAGKVALKLFYPHYLAMYNFEWYHRYSFWFINLSEGTNKSKQRHEEYKKQFDRGFK
jgi:hypothetical protein